MQLFFSYQWSADCCKPLVASRVLKKLILQFLPVSHCFYRRRNFLGSSASSLSSLANLNLKSFCCGNFLFSQFLRLCPPPDSIIIFQKTSLTLWPILFLLCGSSDVVFCSFLSSIPVYSRSCLSLPASLTT